jgi:tetratricopeptide (TPR) repeat protein
MSLEMNNTIVYIKLLLKKHRAILVSLLIAAATATAYYPVHNYDFVSFDDGEYVYENHYIKDGPIFDSILWACTSIHARNWHPITWLSHILDYRLYGLKAGMHHLTNLMFHIANALLLLLILRKMTGKFWQSSVVAGLFALHPLHVESVAWIAERKDVLCAFFWMLTIWSYIRWIERPSVFHYLLTLFLFALGLMAKPMMITLPFVLILLDYWPLDRMTESHPNGVSFYNWRIVFKLIREKIPFLLLVVLSSGVTLYAQRPGGFVGSLDGVPFAVRVANAAVSYVNYIVKMFYPFQLAVLYPYPEQLAWWKITGACLLLVSTTLLAVKTMRKAPYFIVGWLWYVGTLVPVIGLVKVGQQAMADRYTYLPLTGVFIFAAWGVPELAARWSHHRRWLAAVSIALFLILMVSTQRQTRYWENSITLFTHTLNVTSNNWLSHYNLGVALFDKGQTNDAIGQYQEALRIKPDLVNSHYNLGLALFTNGRTEDAIDHYLEALRIEPDYVDAHYNLGLALFTKGQTDDAIEHYLEALRIEPDYVDAHNNLGVALYQKGDVAIAVRHFKEAIQIDPGHANARNNLKKVLRLEKENQ